MNNLTITENLSKKIKQGVSFALVGTMLMTTGARMSKTSQNRDNHRYHELHQTVMDTQQMQVSQGINLYLNDHVFIPRDVLGNEVFPFVYNGTTYVPIRAITSALGAEVSYANNAVAITRKESAKINPGVEWRKDVTMTSATVDAITDITVEVDGQSFIPTDVNGNIVPIYVINGTTYVPLRALCNAFNIPVVWDGLNNRIYLGDHIDLVDPNVCAQDSDKTKQNYYNLSVVAFEQFKMDAEILHQQFPKFKAFVTTLVNTYPLVKGLYHDELQQLHQEVVPAYGLLLEADYKYTDEYIQEEWEFLSTRMNYADELGEHVYCFFQEAYEEAARKVSELDGLCTDEQIEELYNRLNDIVRRYQESLGKSKTLTY